MWPSPIWSKAAKLILLRRVRGVHRQTCEASPAKTPSAACTAWHNSVRTDFGHDTPSDPENYYMSRQACNRVAFSVAWPNPWAVVPGAQRCRMPSKSGIEHFKKQLGSRDVTHSGPVAWSVMSAQ